MLRHVSPILLLVTFGACAPEQRADAARPNIVLLISDDQDNAHLGFQGHPLAHSPNIDRLAEAGMIFSTMHTPPRCRPSLAVLLSGRWPHQSGIYANRHGGALDPQGSLPNRLRNAGYATFAGGKYWEQAAGAMGFDAPAQPDRMFGRAGQDELFAFIDEHAGKQPLFIWWAPALPHTPHDPPMRYQDLIDPEKIDVPSWLPQATLDVFRQYEHMSLAMGAWLDDEIGKLVQKFRSAGLYENTLLLFLIDNGWSNGLVAKGSPFEKGISTPLVATWPARIAPGKRNSAMIESIDLFPTILEAAGLEVPESYPGTSLLGALEGEPFQGRRTICGAIYGRGATPGEQPELDVYALYARTTRWKYIYYLGPVDEGVWSIMKITPLADMIRQRGDEDLFDLAADPLELDDLADDASRRALMDGLRAQALTWWRQSGGVPLE
jgi:uncharacterized sulfatase